MITAFPFCLNSLSFSLLYSSCSAAMHNNIPAYYKFKCHPTVVHKRNKKSELCNVEVEISLYAPQKIFRNWERTWERVVYHVDLPCQETFISLIKWLKLQNIWNNCGIGKGYARINLIYSLTKCLYRRHIEAPLSGRSLSGKRQFKLASHGCTSQPITIISTYIRWYPSTLVGHSFPVQLVHVRHWEFQ